MRNFIPCSLGRSCWHRPPRLQWGEATTSVGQAGGRNLQLGRSLRTKSLWQFCLRLSVLLQLAPLTQSFTPWLATVPFTALNCIRYPGVGKGQLALVLWFRWGPTTRFLCNTLCLVYWWRHPKVTPPAGVPQVAWLWSSFLVVALATPPALTPRDLFYWRHTCAAVTLTLILYHMTSEVFLPLRIKTLPLLCTIATG